MRLLFLVALLSPLTLSAEAASNPAGETVLADDGRQVQLNEDGSWEFVSEDRYATRQDGRRVRLKADGQWGLVDDADEWAAVPVGGLRVSRDSLSFESLSIELSRVVIESARDSRHKNTRVQSQMLFTLELVVDQSATLDLEPSRFTISDSRGRVYDITQVSPSGLAAPGGEKVSFAVVADGAPRWWGIKYLELSINPGTLGNQEQLVLTKTRDLVVDRQVEQLTLYPD